MAKRDVPIVEGKIENIMVDIQDSWKKYSSLLPIALVTISMLVAYDVIKKRWMR